MGRQTRFHMLPDDCRRFVQFLRERDPVIIAKWHSSESNRLLEVDEPWSAGGTYCLWNQAVLPDLSREKTGKYFNVSFAAPVIQFTYSTSMEPWNGRAALVQGRIWAGFDVPNKVFQSWYNATVRWVLKNSVRDQAVGLERDSFGRAAYDWFKAGGVLLPGFRPPLTDAWLEWAKAQNEHRRKLAGHI